MACQTAVGSVHPDLLHMLQLQELAADFGTADHGRGRMDGIGAHHAFRFVGNARVVSVDGSLAGRIVTTDDHGDIQREARRHAARGAGVGEPRMGRSYAQAAEAGLRIGRHVEAEGSSSLERRVRLLVVRYAALPCQLIVVDIEAMVAIPIHIGAHRLFGHLGRDIDGEDQLLPLRHAQRLFSQQIVRLVCLVVRHSGGNVAHIGRTHVVGVRVGFVSILRRQALHPAFLQGNVRVLGVEVEIDGGIVVRHDAACRQFGSSGASNHT